MRCAEFHEQAAAYALDALEDHEREECARHLAEEGPHDGCEALVARYAGVVTSLGYGVPSRRVAPDVWRAIAARVGVRPRLVPRLGTALALAAAAAALLATLYARRDLSVARRRLAETNAQLTSSGGALAQAEQERLACATLLQQQGERSALARDAVALLDDAATRVTPMAPSGTRGLRATALYNPEKKRALAVSSSVPRVDDKVYALWVIAAGEVPRPAGFLRHEGGLAVGEFDRALLGRTPAALAISLEEPGGAAKPTEVVLIAKLGG